MALTSGFITRTFDYKGTILPDPNPAMDLTDVQAIHAISHPELANAKPQLDVQQEDGKTIHHVSYEVAVGTKG